MCSHGVPWTQRGTWHPQLHPAKCLLAHAADAWCQWLVQICLARWQCVLPGGYLGAPDQPGVGHPPWGAGGSLFGDQCRLCLLLSGSTALPAPQVSTPAAYLKSNRDNKQTRSRAKKIWCHLMVIRGALIILHPEQSGCGPQKKMP